MYLVAIIILSLEIISGAIVALPTHKAVQSLSYTKTGGYVLGEADTPDQPTPDQPTADQTQTVTQSDNQQAVSTDTPIGQPQQVETSTSSDTPQSTGIEPIPGFSDSSSAQSTGTPEKIDTSQQTSTNKDSLNQNSTQTDINSGITSLASQVFPDVTNQNPSEQLSQETVNTVKQEEEQLTNVKSPEEQADLLVHFETNSIQSINTTLKNSNFDDSAYNAQRLSYQIDKSLDVIQQLPQAKAADLTNKIHAVCKNTEYLLRPQQLVVPEDVEQAFEITRGKCFNFEK